MTYDSGLASIFCKKIPTAKKKRPGTAKVFFFFFLSLKFWNGLGIVAELDGIHAPCPVQLRSRAPPSTERIAHGLATERRCCGGSLYFLIARSQARHRGNARQVAAVARVAGLTLN